MRVFLRVNLLGGFELFYDEKPVDLAYSTRLQTLITYIVLHRPAPVIRQRLAFIFWPDTSEGQARTNLRNLIHQLRQALPFISTYITFDNNILGWRSDIAFRLDLDTFRQYLVVAPGQTPSKEALAEAVRLYKGDLFPACYDDWILPQRLALNERACAALARLVDMLEKSLEYAAAIGYANQLLRLDPVQETAYRTLMRLHALNGDRAAALRSLAGHIVAGTALPEEESEFARVLDQLAQPS